jgi:hypothetical protein
MLMGFTLLLSDFFIDMSSFLGWFAGRAGRRRSEEIFEVRAGDAFKKKRNPLIAIAPKISYNILK